MESKIRLDSLEALLKKKNSSKFSKGKLFSYMKVAFSPVSHTYLIEAHQTYVTLSRRKNKTMMYIDWCISVVCTNVNMNNAKCNNKLSLFCILDDHEIEMHVQVLRRIVSHVQVTELAIGSWRIVFRAHSHVTKYMINSGKWFVIMP